jgi:hypothetical protein
MVPNEMIRNLLRIEGDFDFFPEFSDRIVIEYKSPQP